MRCRSASSAAQSLQHLWISDDLLAEAFQRFARVSHAQTRTRRHGSNVPGPLEARRRLARRRMGMTTLGSGNGAPPPPEEAAMLFGLGGRIGPPIGVEFAKGWKYEAPSLLSESSKENTRRTRGVLALHWPMLGSDGLPWELDQASQQEPTKDDRSLEEFFKVPEEPVEDKRATTLKALLASLPEKVDTNCNSLHSIYEILGTTMAEPSGSEFIQVTQALGPRKVTGNTWRRLVYFMSRKAANGNMTEQEIVTILKIILQRSEDWKSVAFLFANKVARGHAKGALINIAEYIISTDEHRTKTNSWLQILRSCHPTIQNGYVNSPMWARLYGLLAKHFQPSDQQVVEHFGKLPRTEFAHILLEFYLPTWVREAERRAQVRTQTPRMVEHVNEDATTSKLGRTHASILMCEDLATDDEASTIDYLRSKVVCSPSASTSIWNEKFEYLTTQASLRFPSQRSPNDSEGFAIINVVELLARCRIPYIRLLNEVFEVYTQTQNNSTTKNLFTELRDRRKCGVPTTLAGKLVHHFVASGDLDFAFYVFRSVPTLPLLPYADLLLKLIDQGKTHGDKIFGILTRYHPEERIPLQWRNHRRLSIKQEHIDLVHDVAYAFASCQHLSPRTALRRVWECYRFLQDRRAPLQPVMSRAFVKAGISRPLKENKSLSQEQVKYIIGIVEQVESPHIAQQVDSIVWDAWQWNLERQWSQSLMPPAKGVEGQGQWYEKKRRLWTREGGRVYLPFEEVTSPATDQIEMQHDDANQSSTVLSNLASSIGGEGSMNTQLESDASTGVVSSFSDLNEMMDALRTSLPLPNEQVSPQMEDSMAPATWLPRTGIEELENSRPDVLPASDKHTTVQSRANAVGELESPFMQTTESLDNPLHNGPQTKPAESMESLQKPAFRWKVAHDSKYPARRDLRVRHQSSDTTGEKSYRGHVTSR